MIFQKTQFHSIIQNKTLPKHKYSDYMNLVNDDTKVGKTAQHNYFQTLSATQDHHLHQHRVSKRLQHSWN